MELVNQEQAMETDAKPVNHEQSGEDEDAGGDESDSELVTEIDGWMTDQINEVDVEQEQMEVEDKLAPPEEVAKANATLDKGVFSVERILKQRVKNSKKEYLIKWKGDVCIAHYNIFYLSQFFLFPSRLFKPARYMGARGKHLRHEANQAV